LSPLGASATNWSIVPAPDDTQVRSIWWNENWQGKPKYSGKTTSPTGHHFESSPCRRGGEPDGAMARPGPWLEAIATNFSYIKQYSNQSYGIQLWGTASTSNIGIVEGFQSKALRVIVDAPWYVPNTVTRRDLQIPTVKEEIRSYSS
jgi:hypothetical protein